MKLVHEIEKENMKEAFPTFEIGDTVEVESIIRESTKDAKGKEVKKTPKGKEAKERRQIFSGVVIAMKGSGVRKVFTVRRIVQGEGVERVFPFHSPLVADVRVKKKGVVRRAKLYYLKQRSGKSARIRERIESSSKSEKS